ncbi:MAG: nucleotide pyrophosphohydrolase [Clostridia bacterium]|nr:nucleotide pyrophosphohydrolase [Clostridia bacterium]
MELKEKLEMLNENSSVAEIQQYIKDMKKDRKFDDVTIEREMMLFLEELGELAKAIRKNTKGYLDVAKKYDTSVEEELADCFIYLLSIANMNDIDVFKAFKEKERKNCERIWK